MNETARFMWEQRENGINDTNIPALVAERYGISIRQAEIDFRNTLRQWRVEGLVGPAGSRHHYQIGGASFSVDLPDHAIARELAVIVEHLELRSTSDPQESPERQFAVEVEGSQIVLRMDGLEVLCSEAIDEIMERLAEEVVMHAYKAVDWLVSTHAAAIGTEDGCVLMPGASGAGKSTLTACLLARPHLRYVTEDIALLDRQSLSVVPVPGVLVLKKGSWKLLDKALQDLGSRPTYQRRGQQVRYWVPPRGQIAPAPLSVKAVVFPRRSDQASVMLTPLAPSEGLNQIVAAPATVHPPITAETVDSLVQWARVVPFYSLAYDRLEDAVSKLAALLDT